MLQDISDLVAGRKPVQANPTPLSAIRTRAQKVSNLWIFDSPKNDRRLTVAGDVPFMHLVLLEGDTTVAGYDLVDDPFRISPGVTTNSGYVRVRCRDGTQYWLLVGRRGREAAGKTNAPTMPEDLHERAAEAGVQVHRRSEVELIGKEVLVDNWLILCAIMTRSRAYPSYREMECLLAALARHDTLRVSEVLAIAGIDPAIMLAVIAKALQMGSIETELGRRLFGMHSQLKRVRS